MLKAPWIRVGEGPGKGPAAPLVPAGCFAPTLPGRAGLPPLRAKPGSQPWSSPITTPRDNMPRGCPLPSGLASGPQWVPAAKFYGLLSVLMVLGFSTLNISCLFLHLKTFCPLYSCHCTLVVLLPPQMCS